MTFEDRLRRAFEAASREVARDEAWSAVQERIDRRGRLRRRARWAAWLAPVVVVALGVPAVEVLAPAGRPEKVVTATPSQRATPSQQATPSQPATTSTPPGTTPSSVTLTVKDCPVGFGVQGETAPAMPATATIAGVPAGAVVGAYGGTMVIFAPSGWGCDAVVAADGGLFLWANPGEAFPLSVYGLYGEPTTQTVQVIRAVMPNPFGPSTSVACPFIPAAKADASAAGLPCPGPPAGERVTMLDANTALFEDPAGVAGDGAQSGGPNPAEGVVVRNPTTHAAGMLTCVLPAAQKPLCTAIVDDFRTRYGPGAVRPGAHP